MYHLTRSSGQSSCLSPAYFASIEQQVECVEDWSRLPAKPLVSVAMITYNHEPFIAQALDSILMQEVDFEFEVVIGEDASTDRTRAIVQDYQRRYPDKIRLRLARTNLHCQGLKPGIGVRANCRGKYIAMLEGDDYWTDTRKLQKQVDILEAEPDVVLVHTNVMVLPQDAGRPAYVFYGETDKSLPLRNPWPGQRTDISDLAGRNYISTCSVMYRAWPMSELPAWFKDLPYGDYALWLLSAKRGAIRCLPDVTGVYRQHGGGVMSGLGQVDQIRSMYQARKMLSRVPELKEVRRELRKTVNDAAFAYCGTLAEVIHRDNGRLGAAKKMCREYASRLQLNVFLRRRVWGMACEYAFQGYVRANMFNRAMRLIPWLFFYRPGKLLRWSEVANVFFVAFHATRLSSKSAAHPA